MVASFIAGNRAWDEITALLACLYSLFSLALGFTEKHN